MLYSFDISLSNTGVAIFDEDGNLVEFFSIKTDSKKQLPYRLKQIADRLIECKEKYEPTVVVMERGFYRFNNSTQVIFKAVGVIQYLFFECEQYFITPMEVKKLITGSGKSDKQKVKEIIESIYDVLVDDEDQSDAIAVGCAYLKRVVQ